MTKDLTRGTPWKLILQFALPIMAGNLLQQLYNTADTIIVGNFNGQQALSAVGACASLTVLFTALAIGFSIGAGVLISQYFGASREQELRQYAATAIVLMLAMGLLMSLIGVCSARFLLARALGTPEALLPLTLLYFRIYAAGLVFQFGYNIAAALLRALGDSKATLYFLLVSSVLNVVLDLVFVAGLGMGVAGAAIATVISQIASCVIGFAYMHRRYALLRFSLRELRMDLKTAGRILQVGAPMAIQQSIVSCGFLFLQRLVNYYGESMIASYTVASRMENILMIPIIGIQNTMATYAGQNMGARQPERIRKIIRTGLGMHLGFSALFSLTLFLTRYLTVRCFTDDPAVIAEGVTIICMLAFFYPVFCCVEVFSSAMRGCGNSVMPTVLTLFGTCLLRLALLYTVTFPHLNNWTIAICYPATWGTTSLLFLIYYRFFRWMPGQKPQT